MTVEYYYTAEICKWLEKIESQKCSMRLQPQLNDWSHSHMMQVYIYSCSVCFGIGLL